MINYPKITKQCRVCIHYCPQQERDENTDKYICFADQKKYVTSYINDNGEACCSCHNGKFEYNVAYLPL